MDFAVLLDEGLLIFHGCDRYSLYAEDFAYECAGRRFEKRKRCTINYIQMRHSLADKAKMSSCIEKAKLLVDEQIYLTSPGRKSSYNWTLLDKIRKGKI